MSAKLLEIMHPVTLLTPMYIGFEIFIYINIKSTWDNGRQHFESVPNGFDHESCDPHEHYRQWDCSDYIIVRIAPFSETKSPF